jgi:hypothetical protein
LLLLLLLLLRRRFGVFGVSALARRFVFFCSREKGGLGEHTDRETACGALAGRPPPGIERSKGRACRKTKEEKEGGRSKGGRDLLSSQAPSLRRSLSLLRFAGSKLEKTHLLARERAAQARKLAVGGGGARQTRQPDKAPAGAPRHGWRSRKKGRDKRERGREVFFHLQKSAGKRSRPCFGIF